MEEINVLTLRRRMEILVDRLQKRTSEYDSRDRPDADAAELLRQELVKDSGHSAMGADKHA